MGRFRLFLAALATTLIGGFAANPAIAETDPLREFAVCAGRYAAELEHQALFDDPRAEDTLVQNRTMDYLLAAATGPGLETVAMTYRIDAKVAHMRLLFRAAFNPRREDAEWARRHADAQMADCARLLAM